MQHQQQQRYNQHHLGGASTSRNTKSKKNLHHNANQNALQHSISSQHNTTFDKLQNLKPLREQQNQVKQQSRVITTSASHANLKSSQRDKTPSSRGLQMNLQQKQQQSSNHNQDRTPNKNNVQNMITKYGNTNNLKSNETKTPNKFKTNEYIQYKQQIENYLNQSKERIRQPQIRADEGQSSDLNFYVVKNKKTQKANHQNNQQASNISKQDDVKDRSCTLNSNQQNLSQTQKKHNFNASVKSQKQTLIDDLQKNSTLTATKREDSRNRYSGVKSKVRQQMSRSKTPQGRGAILTQQQYMDQQYRKIKREQEINLLENEVQQIQHDLLFKQGNKDFILSTYKPKQAQTRRKGTDPYDQQNKNNINSDSGSNLQDSTDESQNRFNLTSKKQFSQYEYQLQNHNFSDKYFDKVYLELCGFTDITTGQSQHLEKQRSTFEVKQKNIQPVQNQNPVLSPRAQQTVEVQDIVGSVTFFERRCDQPRPQNHTMVNLDSAYQSRCDNNHINNQNQDGQSHNDECMDSPTQIRRVDDFDRDHFMKMQSVERRDFNLNIGDEEQKRKREELRAENQKLVEDFDNVLNDLITQRKTASHMAFYEAINEYNYDKKQLDNAVYKDPNGSFQVAQSPTKRLICMKNSSIEHIKHIRERNLVDRSGEKPNMVYMASPERSYVVKPDQKIDYSLAFKKNPSKFYDEALNAPITKHKIQQQRPSLSPKNRLQKQSTLGSQSSHSMSQKNLNTIQWPSAAKKSKRDHDAYTIVSKHTTRPHNRINQKIKNKIEEKLADKLGSQLTQQVIKALEEANLQDAINDIISQSSNLVDESNDSVNNNQMGKTMSVKSLQVQKQLFDDCVQDNQSQQSSLKNGKNLVIPSHERIDSQPQLQQNIETNQFHNRSKYQSGQISHRSGASSKFYHSENNAQTEEEVKANKAY